MWEFALYLISCADLESVARGPTLQFGPGLCIYPELGVQVRNSEKGPGQTLVRVQKKDLANTGSAVSEFGEKTRPNPGLEKGMGRNLVRQARRKERAKPWFGRLGVRRKDRAEPWFVVQRKELAESWFDRFGVWGKDRGNPGLAGLEKGTGQTLVWQVGSLEKRQGQNVVPSSVLSWEKGRGPTQVWSLEKGTGLTIVWQFQCWIKRQG